MSAQEYFDNVGREIEVAWAARRGDEEQFPDLAEAILSATSVPEDLGAATLLVDLARGVPMVHQDGKPTFGEPPVMVFRGRDFVIEVLYWLDGTTVIHEHSFSGAFRVLKGSSLHTGYRFSPTERVNRRLQFGDLAMEFAEVLREGDTRAIRAGAAGAHSLFHLERPSVTIVVRTYGEPWAQPQLMYQRPGMAIDPFYDNPELRLRFDAIFTMRALDEDAGLALARGFLDWSDVWGGVLLLGAWFDRADRGAHFDDLLAAMVERAPEVGQYLADVFEERRREFNLVQRRRMLEDARHRLFLAVLLVLPDRQAQDQIFEAVFPGERAPSVIGQILKELTAPGLRGASGLSLSEEELAIVIASLETGSGVDELSAVSSRVRDLDLVRRLVG